MSALPTATRPARPVLPVRVVVFTLLACLVVGGAAYSGWYSRSHPVSDEDLSRVARYPYAVNGFRDATQDVAFYEKRAKTDPTDGTDRAMLARLYLHQARMTNDPAYFMLAEQAALQSLAHQPFNNDNGTMVVARVDEAKHDFRKALELSEQVLKQKPQEDAVMVEVNCYLGLGRVKDADTAADRLIHMQAGTSTYAVQALVKEDQGDEAGVVRCIRLALKREEPNDAYGSAWARTMFGRYFFRHGRYALAKDLYGEALRIMPRFPIGLQQIAEFECATGDLDAAEQHYGEAYGIAPSATYLMGKARIHRLRGDTATADMLDSKAEAMLHKDLSSSPLGHGRDLACLLLERHQGDDVSHALAIMDKDVHNRRDWLTLDAYAWSLQMAHRDRDALNVEKQALSCGIHSAQLLYRESELERALGLTEDAARSRALALQYDPNYVTAHAAVPFML